MNCSELDQMLCPYLDGEFGPDERLDLEGHLATCPACARKVHQESAFRSAFRARAREVAAVPLPEGLRERVQVQIQAEDRRARIRAVMPYAAAAALLAAAGGGGYALRTSTRTGPGDVVARRPDDKLDRRVVRVPPLENARVELVQFPDEERPDAVHITYEVVKPPRPVARHVNMFVFPARKGGDLDAEPLQRPRLATKGGRNVIIWRDDEVIYQLEGEGLDDAEILKMVPMVLPAGDQGALATPPRPTVSYQPAGFHR